MVKDEKLKYFWGSLKNRIFWGGSRKKQYRGGNSLKMGGGLDILQIYGGGRGGWQETRGVDTPMYTMTQKQPPKLFCKKKCS